MLHPAIRNTNSQQVGTTKVRLEYKEKWRTEDKKATGHICFLNVLPAEGFSAWMNDSSLEFRRTLGLFSGRNKDNEKSSFFCLVKGWGYSSLWFITAKCFGKLSPVEIKSVLWRPICPPLHSSIKNTHDYKECRLGPSYLTVLYSSKRNNKFKSLYFCPKAQV